MRYFYFDTFGGPFPTSVLLGWITSGGGYGSDGAWSHQLL